MSGGAGDTSWPLSEPRGTPTAHKPGAFDHLSGRRLASWRRRAAGFAIDAVLMAVVPVALFIAWSNSMTPAQSANDNLPTSAISDLLLAGWFVLGLVVVVAYPVWFIGRRGQTPGMRRMRIRLARIDAEDHLSEVDFATSWRRWFSALFFWALGLWIVTLLIDYLWPLRNRRNQCVHDKWGRTVALEDLM
jgi:uncharacterized RDD family membrane protein YckC